MDLHIFPLSCISSKNEFILYISNCLTIHAGSTNPITTFHKILFSSSVQLYEEIVSHPERKNKNFSLGKWEYEKGTQKLY